MPPEVNSIMMEYFYTLPANRNFEDWIGEIKADSNYIIDTSIFKVFPNDSVYFYMRILKKNFQSPIESARVFMVINAANRIKFIDDKKKILLSVNMEYSLDANKENLKKIRGAYRKLIKQVINYYPEKYERTFGKRPNTSIAYNFYNKGFFFPLLTISKGRYYKDKGWGLMISIPYEILDAQFDKTIVN
jgi:hypothetical protein